MFKSSCADRFPVGLRLVVVVFLGWAQFQTVKAAPPSPTNLVATIITNGVWLSWSAPSDVETQSPDLTYNVRVGSGPGASDIDFANAGHRTNFFVTLTAPPIGPVAPHYYWSVQAMDSAQAGGPFAEEQSFVLAAVPRFIYIERETNGTALLFFAGSNQATYTLESSEDLIHWTELTRVSDPGTEVYSYGDESAALVPIRFYRVRYP